jgi:hypothetical protein
MRARRWVREEIHKRLKKVTPIKGKYIAMHVRHGDKGFVIDVCNIDQFYLERREI